MKEIRISIYAAMTPDRIIGRNGELPWKNMPSDLRRFYEITTYEGAVIMGSKTFRSILARNGKPLPERTNIVLSRSSAHEFQMPGVIVVSSLAEAFREATKHDHTVCVIGGAEVYVAAMPYAERLYLTTIHAPLTREPGDILFPETDASWIEIAFKDMAPKSLRLKDAWPSSFAVYERALP